MKGAQTQSATSALRKRLRKQAKTDRKNKRIKQQQFSTPPERPVKDKPTPTNSPASRQRKASQDPKDANSARLNKVAKDADKKMKDVEK